MKEKKTELYLSLGGVLGIIGVASTAIVSAGSVILDSGAVDGTWFKAVLVAVIAVASAFAGHQVKSVANNYTDNRTGLKIEAIREESKGKLPPFMASGK